MIGVRFGLALIDRGRHAFELLGFSGGHHNWTQYRELHETSSMTVRESNSKLFEMNYSEFEGPVNELGNYDWN